MKLLNKEENVNPVISPFPIGSGTVGDRPYCIYKVQKVNGDNNHYFVCIYDDTYADAFYEKRLDELSAHKFDIRELPNFEDTVEKQTGIKAFFLKRNVNAEKIKQAVINGSVEVI